MSSSSKKPQLGRSTPNIALEEDISIDDDQSTTFNHNTPSFKSLCKWQSTSLDAYMALLYAFPHFFRAFLENQRFFVTQKDIERVLPMAMAKAKNERGRLWQPIMHISKLNQPIFLIKLTVTLVRAIDVADKGLLTLFNDMLVDALHGRRDCIFQLLTSVYMIDLQALKRQNPYLKLCAMTRAAELVEEPLFSFMNLLKVRSYVTSDYSYSYRSGLQHGVIIEYYRNPGFESFLSFLLSWARNAGPGKSPFPVTENDIDRYIVLAASLVSIVPSYTNILHLR